MRQQNQIETSGFKAAEAGRLRLSLFGAVQGVGFRPFVFRLAVEMKLRGWVLNGPGGVVIEAEGPPEALKVFARRLKEERPPAAVIAAAEETWLEPVGEAAFEIRKSTTEQAKSACPASGGTAAGTSVAGKSAWLLPDLAVCEECLQELVRPGERRRGYAFTNCTRCGPRYTIITAIPYDRPNTTMAAFPMCPSCAGEYSDPRDRRFHAQPIACPDCGPRLWLEEGGRRVEGSGLALEGAASLIADGKIVAVKGIGGFHLLCDARSSRAVKRLRSRKGREEKPFAVMFPAIESIRQACELSELEEEALRSAAAPIVLARKRAVSERGRELAEELAPNNPRLGVFLPYAPLHHLLLERLGFPVVATSGNLSEEPIAKTNEEARERLARIADAFLMHDRPIARHADDSIVRLSRGRRSLLRRARGYAPLPIRVAARLKPVLALGAHLKSTVSIAWDNQIVTSQHLGDLETASSWEAFQAAVKDLCSLYDFKPELAACDLHPDYRSSRFAESLGLPIVRVQHHHAHIAACMAEQGIAPPVLGVAWDGFGLGADGALWGGEFLAVGETGFERLAHLRAFPLPGGERAFREPRRSALGLLSEARLDPERLRGRFEGEWAGVKSLCSSRRFAPMTTSAGRLFDAAASLLGVAQVNSFEGQAAMALEYAAELCRDAGSYPFALSEGSPAVADWRPMLEALLSDIDRGAPASLASARFHNGLAELILAAARRFKLERVVLSGGVFQNALLLERAAALLENDGFLVFTPQSLPANDGGISAGQAFIAGLGWHAGGDNHVSGDSR